MTAVSPMVGTTDLVSMTILVDGTTIPDTYQIVQVRVNKQVNCIPSAEITLIDGSASTENFAISDSENLVPGRVIEITAGYHGVEASIFKGIIVKHGIKVKSGGNSFLVITCYSKAIKMTQVRKSGYLGKTDSDIFQRLISDTGLTAAVTATTAVHDGIIRYYATDWDFLVCRAEINGQIVIADDTTVTVGKPQLDADADLLIGYGDAIEQFEGEIDARMQIASVTCSSWDFTEQAVATGSSTEPSVNAQGNLSGTTLASVLGLPAFQLQPTASGATTAQLGLWADAQLLKSRLARLRGNVSFRGNAMPLPGKMVELQGIGDRFNGRAFVSGVRHTIEQGDWTTEVEFGLSPQWFAEERGDNMSVPSASSRTPGVPGLQIAKVKQIDQDPDGQMRVLVDVPTFDMEGNGIWARIASGYATANGGIFFMPEVGDEVILGFLNDDPSCPIVLGSLYSSKQAPPYAADATNTTKAIVTKAQIKISMDDVKKKLQIETPGGHTIIMNDDDHTITIVDSNRNKMTFSSGGVDLQSMADINIKANGAISMEAGTGITVKANADLDMQALNVNAKALIALMAQGQASAELSASGEVTVRGAMVMIN